MPQTSAMGKQRHEILLERRTAKAMSQRLQLLHIRHVVIGIIDWLVIQKQIQIRTPDQEVISQYVFVFVLSVNYCERELPQIPHHYIPYERRVHITFGLSLLFSIYGIRPRTAHSFSLSEINY